MSRKIVILICLILLLGLTGNVSASLVGRWSFDDQTANDSSGNGHNGTLTGNAAVVNDGTRGYVVSLDGTGDYVSLGTGAWTNPGNHATIAAWVKVTTFDAAYQTVVAKGNATYRLHRNNTTNSMAAHMNNTSSGYKAIYGSTSVNDGGWHHTAMTYDGSTMKLYVDGQSNGTVTLSTLYTNSANLCIGRNVDQTTRDWEGRIDDVRLYDNALTETEIRSLAGWTCTISGTVGSLDGVTMNGLPGNPVTSGGGNYTATVEYNWSGTVTLTKAGYTFSPTNKTYANVTANQTAQNYTPTLLTYVIYGTVSDVDLRYDMSSVTMSGLPGNPVTDDAGYYSATVGYGWNGTVTPSRAGFTFAPSNRVYSNVTVDQNSPYDGTVIRYTLSGYTGTIGGTLFESLPDSPESDDDGFYTTEVDYGWSGTATPEREGYTFNPVNKTYSNITSNQTAQNYTPIINTYTISGSVGTLSGVTMNGLPGNPSTNGSGVYTATVNYGWSGTVTPTKAGYVFESVYKVYSSISGNQANQNYTPHQTALDLNMLGWWNFDNSNANDSSGYGYNGTLTGNAAIVDDAERGKVLSLDGSGDYVNLGNGAWTNPGNNMTVAAWVKVNLFSVSYQTIIAKGNQTYRLSRTSSGNKLATMMNDSSGNYQQATGVSSVNDGKWHHAVATYDGTNITLYIDGALEGTNTLSTLYTTSANLCIGRNVDQTSRDWNGFIDSVRFYNKVLTADEIASLYTAESSGLIGLWKFDGNANDSSGMGHNGTMVGDVAIANDGERGQVLQVSTGADTTGNWVDCGGGINDRSWATLSDKMSVLAWVKANGFTAASQYIVTKGTSFIVGRYASDSKLIFETGHWATPLIGTIASNIADNNWHHVAVAYDGAKRYLYIDGFADISDDCTDILLADDYNLLIGGSTVNNTSCWKGYIDDVKLFNKALSETEVRVEAGLLSAERPSPADGTTDAPITQVLDWHAGPLADIVGGQDVYFGTSFDLVNSRDASVFIGNQTDTTYNPGSLANLTTYYWAIDTINNAYPDSPWAGKVWSFTTIGTELVGYWMLNDGTGTTATDTSGYGNNGTITGAAWVTDNAMGKVLDFEGADYITIPSAAFSTISSQITISLWQNGDVALQPQADSIFYGENGSGNKVLNVHLPWSTSIVYWDAGYAGGSADRINKTASANQYEGQWNHWAFTKDTTTGQMKIYLNGEVWTSSTGKTKSMTGITQFKIGSAADGADNYDGMICEFRLYNVVLSDAQILALAGDSIATEPSPAHKAFDVEPYPTLSWKSGPLAAPTDGHDLYLGTNSGLVSARDASVHVGLLDANSYSPSLKLATTYYWVVDEINGAEQWKGDVWKFTVRNSEEGYYKDLFFDGGPSLTQYKASDVPACGMNGYSNEHICTSDIPTAKKVMFVANAGGWVDDNGSLLYPDGEPRFRMVFVNGGDSWGHYYAMEPEGTPRMQTFVHKGGGFTGNCAGSWLAGGRKWNLYPIYQDSGGMGHTMTDGTFPDGQKVYRGKLLPRSLFVDYYPEFFGDYKIHGIRHNGGTKVNLSTSTWDSARTEALVMFDLTWTLKYNEAGAQPIDLSVSGNDQQRETHESCMVWAYKYSPEYGRLVPCGSHPEHMTTYGEEKYLESSILRYVYSGFGRATVKAALTSGTARQMNDNATAGHEKIGDLQYHHFTVTVPQGATQLQIVLDGNLYDMNLYAKNGDFAFLGEQNIVAATNGTGSDETLTIVNPTAGTWYIGVKCNDKVTAAYGSAYYNYTGKFEMLNGLAYTITATVQ